MTEPPGGKGAQELLGLPAAERDRVLRAGLAERVERQLGLGAGRLGADRPLTALGLDSLAAVELRGAVEDWLGIAPDLTSLLSGQSVAGLAADLAAGLEATAGTAAPRTGSAGGGGVAGADRGIAAGVPAAELPLSHGQRGLWFLSRMAEAGGLYHIAAAARVDGGGAAFDVAAWRRALAALAGRHPSLRTTFGESGGVPMQRVHERLEPEVAELDARGCDAAALRRRLEEEAYRPFDLERGPLLRTTVFALDGGGRAVLLVAHHLVADLWSLAVMIEELGALYRQEAAGEPAALAPPARQYGDFVRWEERRLAGPAGARLEQAWRERLAGELPALDLPTDRRRLPVARYASSTVTLRCGAALATGVRRLAGAHDTTVYVVLLAAFQALLYRHSGQGELLVGSPVAGREAPELEGVVGYFVNPVVLRAACDGDASFAVHLAAARREVLSALELGGFPLPLLVERLRPLREPGRAPLFQALFAFQRPPREALAALGSFAAGQDGAVLELGGMTLRSLPLARAASELDLSLYAAPTAPAGADLGLALQYRCDLFDAATMARLLRHLRTLLAAAVAAVETPLAALPLLAAAERAQLLAEWNDTAGALPAAGDACLPQLFAAQAERTPEATAVIAGGERTTYRELARRAGGLSRRLRGLGVGAETRVGIFLDRSTELIVALLGVLGADAAYVPLDPAYPPARLGLVLEDAGVAALVSRRSLRAALPPAAQALPVVFLDDCPAVAGDGDGDCARIARVGRLGRLGSAAASPGNLAYLIYTSGSTGRPKGVAIEHRSAAALLAWAGDTFTAGELAGVLAATSVAFDLSVFEIFLPLCRGGCVILADDVLALPRLPAAGEVTLLNTVPSALAELLRDGPLPPGVRTVNLAGEPLPRALADRLHGEPAVRRVLNLYGPSEDTTYSTWAPVVPAEDGRPPAIGRPIAGTRAYVANARLELAPVGVTGELLLGGAGLARGYVGRPELTAERFVPDPLSGEPGARLYRTGDLVRWLPRGDLEFLGRGDQQVKLRGFRIELGEIEALLAAHPAVGAAAVVMAAGTAAGTRLVAYLTAAAGAEGAAATPRLLRSWLGERLPEHMLPAVYVAVPELPLSPNGKVDRRRLAEWARAAAAAAPAAVGEEPGAPAGGRPRTVAEEVLAGIWEEVLALERVGTEDDFFALGGHSLLAAQVSSRVRRLLAVELPLRRIFELPRLAALAEWIEAARRSGGGLGPGSGAAGAGKAVAELAAGPMDGDRPLSFGQQRLWFIDQLEPGSTAYNVAQAVELAGRLDRAALAHGCTEIVRRHHVLRTTFVVRDGRPAQVVAPSWPLAVPLIDLAGLPAPARAAEAHALARQEAGRPFDLARGPLLRVCLVRLAEERHWVLLSLHHIVCDGWSMGVLLRELSVLYEAAANGRPPSLPELPLQYADFARWQRALLEGEAIAAELGFWRRRLAGAPALLELPADRPRGAAASRRGAALSFVWPGELAAALRRAGRGEGATLFMALLAGFQALLARYTQETDLLTGTPVAGRRRFEVEGLIGLFVNTLALRGDLSGEPSFRILLARAREVVLEADLHQDLPFERLVEELHPARSLAHAPLFQVMLALQNAPAPAPALHGLRLELLPEERLAAKFDLTLSLREAGDLHGSLEYDADLFDGARIERLAGHLRTLAAAAAEQPDLPFTLLPLLDPAEREQLLRRPAPALLAAPAPAESGAEICLHELFAAQAALTPEAEAVVGGEVRWTYRELASYAHRLAQRLRRHGIGAEARVGVFANSSPQRLGGLLAILAAGGAYVPLDPAYPEERLRFIAADAGLSALLVGEGLEPRLPESLRTAGLPRLGLGGAPAGAGGSGGSEETAGVPLPPSGAGADNLAYLIYTSGSTGRPKAVAVSHRAAAALLAWTRRAFSSAEMAAVLASSSINFDLSVFEMFAPLVRGGKVVLAANLLDLPALAAAAEVTLINTVPAALAELLRLAPLPAAVRTVNLAGEPLPRELADRVHALGTVARLINLYGPAEDTTYSTAAAVEAGGGAAPALGTPIAGSYAYLLDPRLELTPAGVPGEIYLGGAGLARGYFGRPELSAERFVPDPYAGPAAAGSRLYRTGDLARRRPGGELEFLGRADHQIKLRGFRIELGEVEAALLAQPGVREAAAVVGDWAAGDRRLAAFVVAAAAVEPGGGNGALPGQLRAALAARLPAHLVPAFLALLPELPRTLSGKVDRRALEQALAAAGLAARQGGAVWPPQPPGNQVEELLAAIWADVLGQGEPAGGDDFFVLGGHSLLATQVMARVRRDLGVDLPLRSLFEAPTLTALAARVEAARGARGAGRPAPPAIHPLPRQAPPPLSYAQQRLWFLAQLEPASSAYNIAQAVEIQGSLDVAALAWSLSHVVRRHEALRTTFAVVDGQPVQVVGAAAPAPLSLVDLAALPIAAARAEAERLATAAVRRPFDLERGPLLRWGLARLAAGEHLAHFVVHHAAGDGWSMGILVREMAALYAARRHGRPSPLPELPIQYADYAAWQRLWLAEGALEEQLGYWRRQLAGAPPVLALPADWPRHAIPAAGGETLAFLLPEPLLAAVQGLGRQHGTTLFMTLLAAFQLLLGRYATQDEVSVATPIAGRRHVEMEGLIGLFVNTLVLRAALGGRRDFANLLAQVRETTLAAFAHQDLPFERLVEELQPERSLAAMPLAQVLFTVQNEPRGELALAGLVLTPRGLDTGAAKFDLALALHAGARGLAGRLTYRRDLFLGATARRFAGHLETLLANAVAAPGQPIQELPLLTPGERAQVLVEWSAASAGTGAGSSPVDEAAEWVHQAFERQAASNPAATAAVCETAALTFGELNRRANRLARRLRALGAGAETRVGLFAGRSLETLVGLLAVLKAGGAYVPLDPSSPPDHLAFVLADTGAPLVLTIAALAAQLPASAGGARLLFLDAPETAAPGEGDDLRLPVAAANLAYVIYTSGSTGRPKGVGIEHRQLAAYVRGAVERLDLQAAASFATVSTFAADLGNTAVFPALTTGGCLHVISRERATDPEAFAEYCHGHRIDCLKIVPSHLAALQAAAHPERSLPRRRLVLGGEASTWEEIAALRERAPRCRIFNHYGPTETTVGALVFEAAAGARSLGSGVPLGRPLPGAEVRLLSPAREPLPAGVPGELCIGGAGVARGYLGAPALTAERFVPDPWSGRPGARLYRSGDLARFLADGNVEFLGRIDRQLKVRGFRVEPGEIAAVLLRHPAVHEAVVVAPHAGAGQRRLVAYVVPAPGAAGGADLAAAASPGVAAVSDPAVAAAIAEWRELLGGQLPDYMMPAAFVVLAALPLTSNGKLDEAALPPAAEPLDEAAGGAPRTPIEELLAGIWSQLLGRRQCGIHDDFFALGGHSLLATRLIARLRQVFAVELPLRSLFEAPTLAALAARIAALRRAGDSPLAPALPAAVAPGPMPHASRPPRPPLSFAQERLWFLDQLEPGRATYNLPYYARVSGALALAPLAAALHEVSRRHESLRTRFPADGGQPWQEVASAPALPPPLPLVDLGALPDAVRYREAERILAGEAARPFDLGRELPLRAGVLRLEGELHFVLLTLHHIASDAWSRRLLAHEVAALYTAAAAGRPSPLAAPALQYADYALWQRQQLQGEALQEDLAWWRRQLAGAPPLELPADRQRPPARSGRGGVWLFLLPAPTGAALAALALAERGTPFMVLLAAFAVLLHRYTGQDDLVIGSPVANRQRAEVEGLAGCFVNTLALRAPMAGRPTFRQALEGLRAAVLDAYDHQQAPFEKVVEAVAVERSLDRLPLVQVILLLQEPPERLAFGGLDWTPLDHHNGSAKFDLTLAMRTGEGELGGALEYDADLYDAATAARLCGHLAALVDGLLAAPGEAIAELPLLGREEREQLAAWNAEVGAAWDSEVGTAWDAQSGDARKAPGGAAWNAPGGAGSGGEDGPCVHQLFAAQAQRTPDATALVCGERRLSYEGLARLAGRLAGRLRRLGVGPEVRVGVCLERSVELVAALLAVLEAGGAYVPLDPDYPGARLAFMVADAAAPLVLTRRSLLAARPQLTAGGALALCLEDGDEESAAERAAIGGAATAPAGAAASEALPGNLAYVIYTSGSTGWPKGVAITHRSAAALLLWAREAFAAAELSAVLATTSICFDLSVFELFAPLAWGGKVVLAANLLELPCLAAAGEVTLLNTVPSALAELLRAGGLPASVRTINLAGEPLPRQLAEAAYAAGSVDRVCNLYGPSEDTTYSTCCEVRPGAAGAPAIGRPLPGTQAHVLDAGGLQLPVGVPGELYLGGAALARGYLGRPDLTAARFLPDPFSGRPGTRCYRTGDLVRRRPDGGLDFLGRVDHQVKVRGFRIELGEIERALAELPRVREAAVLVHEDEAGEPRLVACVAPAAADELDLAALRAGLAARLPAFMVPSIFLSLPALPRTPNGKLDRRALAAAVSGGAAGAGVAGVASGVRRLDAAGRRDAAAAAALPRTPVEQLLAQIWERVLGIERVGLDDDFFALGGHSLLAARVVAQARQALGVELPLRSLFEAPTLSALTARVEAERSAGGGPPLPPLVPAPPGVAPVLSFAQQRLWLLHRLDPGSAAYNMTQAVELSGPLDRGALARAFGEVARRHEPLRTLFAEVGGEPIPVLSAAAALPLPLIDLGGLPPSARLPLALRLARAESARPFALARGPLLRASLVRLEPRRHLALTALHHVAGDGWSLALLVREVAALYAAFAAGLPSPLAELALRYTDYAWWQRQALAPVLESQLAYWRAELAGAPPLLEMPVDRPRRGAERTGRLPPAGARAVALPAELGAALRRFGRAAGATPFMVLAGALAALLARLTGGDDLLLGTVIAGRRHLETEDLIGCFVNTLALRARLGGNPSFDEVVRRLRETALAAYAHQDLPFERLVEELQPRRGLAATPPVQAMLALQNAPAAVLELAALRLRPLPAELTAAGGAKFELALALWETGEGFEGRAEFDPALFDGVTIERLVRQLSVLLRAAVEHPGQPLAELPLLGAAERHQMEVEWSTDGAAPPSAALVPQCLALQAARTPLAPALVCGEVRWSHGDLDLRARGVMRLLLDLGAGVESRIAVCLDRSPALVAALLGTWKAGAAFVPLDPGLPAQRLEQLLADAAPAVLIAGDHLAADWLDRAGRRGIPVLRLDREGGAAADAAASGSTEHPTEPGDLAYMIYTSGTSGGPKAVLVEHGSLAATLAGAQRRFGFTAGDVMPHLAPFSFDIALFELLMPLLAGGTSLLLERAEILDVERLADRLGEATRLHAVPSLMQPLTAALLHRREPAAAAPASTPRLHTVFVGGERVTPELLAAMRRALDAEIVVLYGPTEAAIICTSHRVPPRVPHDAGTAPRPLLGRPLPGVELLLVDAAGSAVPIGVAGEVLIGGAAVARGYRQRAALERERFAARGGRRFYRTGDLARYLPNGNLEFLGRGDEQIKVRGHRVELGEIEDALASHPAVAAAVVVARRDAELPDVAPAVVAYVVPRGERPAMARELRQHLAALLPDYMLPAHFVSLAELPLLPSGKVDRRALPAPEPAASGMAEGPPVMPRTPVEEVLAGIWAQLLGREPAGVDDDFFALGGHSLLVARVASRVRELLGVELPLREVFEQPTLAGLARRVEALRDGGEQPPWPAPVRAAREGGLPLSFAQERLWFLDQLEPGGSLYNIAQPFAVEGDLDLPALAASLSALVRRHEALRTTFAAAEGEARQLVGPPGPAALPVVDLRALPAAVRQALAQRLARADARRPFDLARGPLLRLTLLRLGDGESVALLALHHIAGDGWSMRVLAHDLEALYRAGRERRPSPLPELPLQYADYAAWQRRCHAGGAFASQLAFWRQRLGGNSKAAEMDEMPAMELPADRPRPAVRRPLGAVRSFVLPAGLSIALKALGRRHGATPFMTLLAVFQLLLARHAGGEQVSIGTPVTGRGRVEMEDLIGFFVNILVLRGDLGGSPDGGELLRRVREATLAAFAHQDLPFDRLVRELRPERTLAQTLLFAALFALQSELGRLPDLPGLRLRALPVERGTAKFDLTLALEETAGGFAGRLEYATDLYDAATIERLLGHFAALTAGLVERPEGRVLELPLLSPAERHQMELEWSDTAAAGQPWPGAPALSAASAASGETCIHHLFAAQAARTPEALALIDDVRRLTYRQLDGEAEQLARHLRAHGVGPDVLAAVFLERSAELVVALLAVLKAGGAYVPVDPDYPAERVAFMIGDARAAVVLTSARLAPTVAAHAGGGAAVLAVDELPATPAAGGSPGPPPAPVGPDHLAYAIYTSGSTGRPKAAMNTHRAVVNRLLWAIAAHGFTAADRFLHKTPFSFDVSVWELFCPLLIGAPLVVAAPQGHRDPQYLARRIAAEAITTLHFVPAMLQAFLEVWEPAASPALRRVICSGEALPAELERRFLAATAAGGVELWNLYGPTEAAVDVTAWRCNGGGAASVPIGRPIANAQIRLLDDQLRPVPIGAPGELFIGGLPVGRGYLRRPDLTAERFVPDPFAGPGAAGARLYRTGDLAHHLPGGAVAFLGRRDHQVKVRGLRIELGEIEAALAQHPGVAEAVVVARREAAAAEPRLAAYFVPRGQPAPDFAELRRHLARLLPEYMLPSSFVAVAALPLSPSGKIDRATLQAAPAVPGAGGGAARARVYAAPRTPAEQTLAAIWSDVLGVEAVGVDDNFFELGGDSILSLRIVARANRAALPLHPRHLFQHQTVAELAAAIAMLPVAAMLPVPAAGVPAAELSLPGLGEDPGDALDEIEFERRTPD